MRLTHITLNNFRCFDKASFDLDAPLVLIHGSNGSGKSSLLEALHYLCYLRSFRGNSPRDLIRFGQDDFFIKAQFRAGTPQALHYDLHVGFTKKKRSVKLNKKSISSFKELMDFYRIITLTEDDLTLIKGGPDVRRQFVDQALGLEDQRYVGHIRSFKQVLDNRNALLQTRSVSKELYDLWTQQLWNKTREIQRQRVALIGRLEKRVNTMLSSVFDESLEISLGYRARNDDLSYSFDDFMDRCIRKELQSDEIRYGRSLFGAHLDDIIINFQGKKSKIYASRGQQKLIVVLLKAAQLMDLTIQRGHSIFLLDDFMTDFDETRSRLLVNFLASLECQLIFTSPTKGVLYDNLVGSLDAKRVNL